MSRALRLGFAGTPAFAAIILKELLAQDHQPVVVYTQPDRPRGRGKKLHASPVKALAEAHALPIEQPARFRDEASYARLANYRLDLLLVAAYGLLLPKAVLETPACGCVNVHASLLPRWRGAAPVERAIMAGDEETGVCLMQMDEGLDTGAVLAERRLPIDEQVTGGQLEERLARLGAGLLCEWLSAFPSGAGEPQPEDGVTYAKKLTRDDSVIQWEGSADTIARQIRALADRAPAFSFLNGERVRLLHATSTASTDDERPGTLLEVGKELRIQCGTGAVAVTRLALSRGKGTPMAPAAASNGYPELFTVGAKLTNHSESER